MGIGEKLGRLEKRLFSATVLQDTERDALCAQAADFWAFMYTVYIGPLYNVA